MEGMEGAEGEGEGNGRPVVVVAAKVRLGWLVTR